MKVAIYARVSEPTLTAQNQFHACREEAARRGCAVVGEWGDIQHGDIPPNLRGGWNEMMKAAGKREFDLLMFYAWDRVTRGGIGAAFDTMRTLKAMGLGWVSVREPFLSADGGKENPAQELILAILAWAAEFERKRIGERTRAALASRKALGVHVGRAKGRKDSPGVVRRRRWAKAPILPG